MLPIIKKYINRELYKNSNTYVKDINRKILAINPDINILKKAILEEQKCLKNLSLMKIKKVLPKILNKKEQIGFENFSEFFCQKEYQKVSEEFNSVTESFLKTF